MFVYACRRRGPTVVLLMQSHRRTLILSAVVRGESLVSERCRLQLGASFFHLPVNKAKIMTRLKGQFNQKWKLCHQLFTLSSFQKIYYFLLWNIKEDSLQNVLVHTLKVNGVQNWNGKKMILSSQKFNIVSWTIDFYQMVKVNIFFKISLCSTEGSHTGLEWQGVMTFPFFCCWTTICL